MSAYLIGEDGPHAGTTIDLAEADEWILGRDPDVCYFVLEDPMVSRKHALIRFTEGHYYLENLSTVNPVQVNGEPALESVELFQDDIIQIGNSFFRFSESEIKEPLHDESVHEREIEQDPISTLPFSDDSDKRWVLKVISGPNQGAEFGMNPGETHILGKDPNVSDIIFQDLSVSRQHAKIHIDQSGTITIEDLGSRNGVLVNGSTVEGIIDIHSQDLISLGTTSFLLIDRMQSRETIFSPATMPKYEKEGQSDEEEVESEVEEKPKSWKETFIPTRHLVIASLFSLVVFAGVVSFLALFRSQTIVVDNFDECKEIKAIVDNFENVQFSYTHSTGKVFLIGHVLTDVDHSELMYLIHTLSFIESVEDNIVVDEKVWEEMNTLLAKRPNWRGVMVTAPKAGKFVVRGYLETEDEAAELKDYINLYFPYLNLLENQVVVENTLNTQIQSLLIEKGFVNVTFQFYNGELIFAGRVNSKEERDFDYLSDMIKKIHGIRQIKNFVIFTNESTARIDLTGKYSVTGTSRYGNVNQYILINGKILSRGDSLDGMTITGITNDEVELDRDGIKYKIDYNLQ